MLRGAMAVTVFFCVAACESTPSKIDDQKNGDNAADAGAGSPSGASDAGGSVPDSPGDAGNVGGGEPNAPPQYHLVEIGRPGFKNVGVAAVSRGGKVLLFGVQTVPVVASARWIYDTKTGDTRDAPDALWVNDSGTTVGIRLSGKDASGKCDDYEVFLQQPDGRTQSLGNPVHGDYGSLDCYQRGRLVELLDEQGRPVVYWRSESRANPGNFFRWNGSSWDRLPPVGGFIDGITAVNDRGDLAGCGGTSSGGFGGHAALWRDGVVTEIGTFGGSISCARGINNADQVVGYATMTPGVLDERPFLWSNGALRELELPAGFDFSEAYAIADNGEVGAEAFTPVPSWVSVHGILWTRDGVHDVNDLTDTHDWLVTTILAMTRDGDVIAGALDRNVQPHAVVLIRGAPAVPDKSWRGDGDIVADGQNAVSLALDGPRVYWQQALSWSPPGRTTWLFRATAKSGAGAVFSVGTGPGDVYGPLVADGGFLWFAYSACLDPPDCSSVDSAVLSLAPDGSTTRVGLGVGQLAVKSGVVFSKAQTDGLHAAVYRTPGESGDPQILDTMELPYSRVIRMITGIDTDESSVFYTWSSSRGDVTVRAQPLAGGKTRDLFAGESRLQGTRRVKVDGEFVYIQLGQEILRVSTRGGALEQVVAPLSSNAYINDMDVKDGHIWWTVPANTDGQGCLRRADADGSNAFAIECGLHDYRSVRVDDSGVYLLRDLQIVRYPN